ncbi:retropepsin-like aspartic protease family protein [Pistricoccus aurantiacus]|nr:TIGR02281 family clan AA aspartic protease [Pistricoccus aurantiacus]
MSKEARGQRRFGLGMLVLWVLLMAMAFFGFQRLMEERRNPNADLARMTEGQQREVTLERNGAGHFVASGRINGEVVEFLLDTGATQVAVPGKLAERLGLKRGPGAVFRTANGTARGYLTQLDKVSLGGLVARDVSGPIGPGMGGDTVLLGMSFLNRFDIQIRGDRMVLSVPEAR